MLLETEFKYYNASFVTNNIYRTRDSQLVFYK